MKKILVLILALVMVASLCTVSFAEDQENVAGNYNPEDSSTALAMLNADFERIGSVISTVADATRVVFVCPSWSDNVGNLTVTLWKWDTDYKTTVKAAPVAGPTVFEDYEDNSPVGFEFEEGNLLPAGVYYIELSDAEDQGGSGVGVWSAGLSYPGQYVLRDGEYVNKLSLRMFVDYATPVEGNPYGEMPKIEKPKSELGCDDTLPCVTYFKMAKYDLTLDEGTNTITLEQNEDGTLLLTVVEDAFDSMYSMNFDTYFQLEGDEEPISCQDYPYMAIRLRLHDISKSQGPGEAFMYTTSSSSAVGGYSSAIRYDWTTDDWQTVVIDPTSNSAFKKNALNGDEWLGFRFDALNGSPDRDIEMDIDWIAFFGSEEAALAFDGDFTAVDALVPTKAPTPEPTATPEVTEAPATQAPVVTEKPADPTDKATEAPTAAPVTDNGNKNNDNGNKFPVVPVVIVAAVVVAAVIAAIIIANKKKKK